MPFHQVVKHWRSLSEMLSVNQIKSCTSSLEALFELRRGKLSLQEYASEWELRYEDATTRSGAEINSAAKTSLFFRTSGLPNQFIEDVKLQIQGSKTLADLDSPKAAVEKDNMPLTFMMMIPTSTMKMHRVRQTIGLGTTPTGGTTPPMSGMTPGKMSGQKIRGLPKSTPSMTKRTLPQPSKKTKLRQLLLLKITTKAKEKEEAVPSVAPNGTEHHNVQSTIHQPAVVRIHGHSDYDGQERVQGNLDS